MFFSDQLKILDKLIKNNLIFYPEFEQLAIFAIEMNHYESILLLLYEFFIKVFLNSWADLPLLDPDNFGNGDKFFIFGVLV